MINSKNLNGQNNIIFIYNKKYIYFYVFAFYKYIIIFIIKNNFKIYIKKSVRLIQIALMQI